MAETDENKEWHARHIVPNVAKGISTGFKQLGGILGEATQTLLPFAALASDPLLAFGLKGLQIGGKGLGAGLKSLWNIKNIGKGEDTTIKKETEEKTLLKDKVALLESEQKRASETGESFDENLIADANKRIADIQTKEDKRNLKENTKKMEELLSGSPPYLLSIRDYLYDFQYPLLETIAKVKNNDSDTGIFDNTESNQSNLIEIIKQGFTTTISTIALTSAPISTKLDYINEGIFTTNKELIRLQEIFQIPPKKEKDKFAEEKARESEDRHENLVTAISGISLKPGGEKEKKKGLLSKFGGFKDMLSNMIALATGSAGGGVLSGMLSGLGGGLLKASPYLAVAAGIAMAAMDAVAGWSKAEEWGTSKFSGAMGGLLGGTGSGMGNALKNAGKWAGIGLGIGKFFGPIGMIAGALIGAALGGILGFIGGEKIAKAFNAVGQWFKDIWGNIVEAWKLNSEAIAEWAKKIWGSVSDWFINIWDKLKFIFSKKGLDAGIAKLGEWMGNLGKWLSVGFVKLLPGFLQGPAKKFLGVTDADLSGMVSDEPTQGQQTYQSGTENADLNRNAASIAVSQANSSAIIQNNSSSNAIYSNPMSYDPSMRDLQRAYY